MPTQCNFLLDSLHRLDVRKVKHMQICMLYALYTRNIEDINLMKKNLATMCYLCTQYLRKR